MEKQCEIKQYKKRWINLVLFVMYAINNGVHWTQFSVINNVISEYYHVSSMAIEWTSCIFMLVFVIFTTPVLYTFNKVGVQGKEKVTQLWPSAILQIISTCWLFVISRIRYLMILVNAMTCFGSWLKLFSVAPDRFYVAFIAQTVEAIAAVFTYGLAARFTAEWFGIHEISRAGALAIFGDQFGNALSFVVPVQMVPYTSDVTSVENGLSKLHQLNAFVSTVVLILVIVVFQNHPKRPPSVAQALKKDLDEETLVISLKKMMRNRAFIMLLISYSLAGSVINAISSIINEIILRNFPSNYSDGGNIGFVIMVVGMFSSPVIGYILDKTRRFKEIAIFLYGGGLISIILFSVALKAGSIIYVYLASAVTGVFFISIYGNGSQIGIEIIYPISEDKCTVTMFCILQLFSLITTVTYSALMKTYGDLIANVFLIILCAIAVLLPILAPIDLKRQKADEEIKSKEFKTILNKSSAIC